MYTKESLELLRQRIDLVEVLTPHLQLHRAGAAFKALCPFHEEKTPSFIVQRGDSHYHCFGCGAHGDAIAFLMNHVKMSFTEAVEHLAERFGVPLEKMDASEEVKGPSKSVLKEALDRAARLYHFLLLHSEEGQKALEYLYQRGIDLDFIRTFQIGYASNSPDLLKRFLYAQNVSEEVLLETGLIAASSKRDFFCDRITFPIRDPMGAVIGFSARKFKEETYGGKYINTSETPLFKKSQVLFALSYCRQKIAKERKAIIVEGQIDALRLIHSGFNYTVAGQGTAFGEGHVRELCHLGVNHVYLALDGDTAGQEAAVKIGHLFQRKGVEVTVISLPPGADPDSLLKERGPDYFKVLFSQGKDYLTFLFAHLAKTLDPTSPSQKNEIIKSITERISDWEQPVMVYESMRKLAQIADIPESALPFDPNRSPHVALQTRALAAVSGIDPHRILEGDLLRWLLLRGETEPKFVELITANLKPKHFRIAPCRRLFERYLELYHEQKPRDLLSLAIDLDDNEGQLLISEIMDKKINLQRAEEGIKETIHKILLREWMDQREAIKMKIHSGKCSDEEALELARQFDAIKKNPPAVVLISQPAQN